MSSVRSSPAVSATLFAACGLAWGVLAWLFGRKAFGPSAAAGVLASPFIGVAVGFALQARFERAARGGRIGWSLLSLYFGALLFGLVIGIADNWGGPLRSNPLESLGEGVLAAGYGVTISGFFILFWPLAWLTHRVLAALREVRLPE